ncbi:hypothetical protein SARC_13404, partial [Sphaeroforma arctica JP610]
MDSMLDNTGMACTAVKGNNENENDLDLSTVMVRDKRDIPLEGKSDTYVYNVGASVQGVGRRDGRNEGVQSLKENKLLPNKRVQNNAEDTWGSALYVDWLAGSDDKGNGTPQKPFRTFSKGIRNSQEGGVIYATVGDYEEGETLSVDISVRIRGGMKK